VCQFSECPILIKNSPLNGSLIHANVTVSNTQTNDFIFTITNQIDTEIEIVADRIGGAEFHNLNFLPKNSSNCSNECCGSDYKTLHILIEFLIINLLQFHEQIISRRERFGQFHCEEKVKESVQEGCGIAIIGNVMTIQTNLSVTEFLCQIITEIVCLTLITHRLRLIRGRGDDNFVTHEVCLN